MFIDVWWVVGLTIIGILLFVAGLILWFLWPTTLGAVWIPMARDTIREMLTMAKVNQQDIVYDLGSGDGRVVLIAAEEFGATAIGIEVDPLRVLWSRRVIRRRNLCKTANIIWGNFFHQDLARATVITVYQGHEINKRLKPKLASELKSGTRVISFSFPFEGWTPIQSTEEPRIYLYQI
ncbi:MAG: SAM-dependent methyltransferase [Candidatus Thorarchaeota archaeon]